MFTSNDTTSIVQYKLVEGRPDYMVGDDGSAWSRRITGARGHQSKLGEWKTLKPPKPTSPRYHRIDIDGQLRYVHVLVLTEFVGPCPQGMECRHLNGNRHDNRLCNLAWGTHEENMKDALVHGTTARGVTKRRSSLTEDSVREIRDKYMAGERRIALAWDYGISVSTVSEIVLRKTWTHI